MVMLIISGATALSSFRLEKTQQALQAIVPGIKLLMSDYFHFVDSAEPLSTAQQSVLDQLLDYGPR